MNSRLLAEARAWVKRGALLTPLNGKIPTQKNWTKAPQMSDGELARLAYTDMNYGVRTGNGMVVADVDNGCDPDVVAKLDAIRTPTVRTGSGGKHYYFRGNGKCSVGKVSEHLDIRGEGGQVVGAGSIHPDTGQPYEWIITPDEAEFAPYPTWLDEMAHQAKRIRKAPEGQRNNTLNKATFAAASAGAPTRELADAAVDAGLEPAEIEATIKSATRAAPAFAPVFNEDAIMVPGEHFMPGGSSVCVDQTTFCKNVWEAIPKGSFYSRFNIVGEIKDAVFTNTDTARFRALASRWLHLVAYCKDGRAFTTEYRNFSADMGALVVAAGAEHTENVEAITCYPLAGGPHKGWLVIGEHPIEPVTDHHAFWKELLCDFPWKSDNDRHVFVSLLFSLIMRPLIDGPVPPYMIAAAQERTGKTKLINEVLAILYGREVSNLALGDDEAELEKRLVARSFGGHTVLAFDNVRGKIDSPALASYCTSRWFSGRVLGLSKTVEFPVNALTVLTANNPSMSGEIAKRMMRSTLASPLEHPENRTDFKYPDLRAHLIRNRAKMLGSLLAMAELPEGPAFVLGGFEAWGRAVGGRMATAGMPLSQEAYTQSTIEADDETADARTLIQKWSVYPEYTSIEQMLSLVKEAGIMPRVLDAPSERGQLIRMGHVMRALNGRVFGEYQVRSDGSGSRRTWRLVRA